MKKIKELFSMSFNEWFELIFWLIMIGGFIAGGIYYVYTQTPY